MINPLVLSVATLFDAELPPSTIYPTPTLVRDNGSATEFVIAYMDGPYGVATTSALRHVSVAGDVVALGPKVSTPSGTLAYFGTSYGGHMYVVLSDKRVVLATGSTSVAPTIGPAVTGPGEGLIRAGAGGTYLFTVGGSNTYRQLVNGDGTLGFQEDMGPHGVDTGAPVFEAHIYEDNWSGKALAQFARFIGFNYYKFFVGITHNPASDTITLAPSNPAGDGSTGNSSTVTAMRDPDGGLWWLDNVQWYDDSGVLQGLDSDNPLSHGITTYGPYDTDVAVGPYVVGGGFYPGTVTIDRGDGHTSWSLDEQTSACVWIHGDYEYGLTHSVFARVAARKTLMVRGKRLYLLADGDDAPCVPPEPAVVTQSSGWTVGQV